MRRRNERVRRQGPNRSSAANGDREIASTSRRRREVVRTREEIDKMCASAVRERQAEVHFVQFARSYKDQYTIEWRIICARVRLYCSFDDIYNYGFIDIVSYRIGL